MGRQEVDEDAYEELSLQIDLGEKDYSAGLLNPQEEVDLSDFRRMRGNHFFAGRDEYIRDLGLDGALKRFRQSRLGYSHSIPSRQIIQLADKKISKSMFILSLDKKELLKIS